MRSLCRIHVFSILVGPALALTFASARARSVLKPAHCPEAPRNTSRDMYTAPVLIVPCLSLVSVWRCEIQFVSLDNWRALRMRLTFHNGNQQSAQQAQHGILHLRRLQHQYRAHNYSRSFCCCHDQYAHKLGRYDGRHARGMIPATTLPGKSTHSVRRTSFRRRLRN